jgi:hypothetical protein
MNIMSECMNNMLESNSMGYVPTTREKIFNNTLVSANWASETSGCAEERYCSSWSLVVWEIETKNLVKMGTDISFDKTDIAFTASGCRKA